MPFPVTHIAIACRFARRHFSGNDLRDFYLGNLFPDIRYLNVITREESHYEVVSADLIPLENPFIAGVYYHSLVDEFYSRFREESGIYSGYPGGRLASVAFRIAEDRYFYNKIAFIPQLLSWLSHIPPEAVQIAGSASAVETWYNILKRYLRQPPGKKMLKMGARFLDISHSQLSQSEKLYRQVSGDQKVKEMLERLAAMSDFSQRGGDAER